MRYRDQRHNYSHLLTRRRSMKAIIAREELKKRLNQRLPTIIFEALPAKYFTHAHIPGAHQLDHVNVQPQSALLAQDKSSTIVVYCASATCRNSHEAADGLVALGYHDVRVYVEGKKDWIEAGLPVEGGYTAA